MGTSAGHVDVIVVGGGHNGLICAAYLARAGIETLVIEARDEVGGCASTVSDLGARFNICNCDHTLIRAMPIMDELDLAAHGLRYLEADAGTLNLYYDGSDPWFFFPEIERQLDSLDAVLPSQVAGYRRYLDDALPVANLVLDMARARPGSLPMAQVALRRRADGAARLLDWAKRSVDDVMADYFDDWRVTMPVVTSGPSVWGVHPSTPGTGLAALGYASRHLVTTGRPEGGSGALTDATRASFEAAGGQVRCGSRVERLLMADGQVVGVRLDDGTELSADAVVAACDPQRVLVDWIDEPPAAARRLVDRWRNQPTHDGYESKVDAIIEVEPRYRAAGDLEQRHPGIDLLGPTAYINPNPEDLAEA
ncbi:MAG: NAD(P)/FAD-dependent oxidoreductase, partial [Actinomycetota bacterium]